MSKWNKTCYSFREVRHMLLENIETTEHCVKIMYALENCCDELTPNYRKDWIFYDDFRDLKANIHDEIEYMDENNYESCEWIVNGWLDDFYDLCDAAKVWLGV